MNALATEFDQVLSRHLARFSALTAEEAQFLRPSALGPLRTAEARYDLIREGEAPRAVFLIVKGWACRYKMLEDGRKQIVGFLVPGDLCDLNNSLLVEMDHSLGAITRVHHVEIAHDVLKRLTEQHPGIARALWIQLLAGLSIQREWTLNLGQRIAIERIGHLFCELFVRMRAVGLAEGGAFELPITQNDIADATGLTAVHVNRTLQELRGRELINLHNRTLRILDFESLSDLSLFSPSYLHMQPEQAHAGAKPAIGIVAP
ncbi:Crp/Fnr family transcriptional regulator [Sphingomonas zeicaulis]|uniref:Crp/Fnr family transcriptional regulator n=1 Tax=Sphingomonas zeicaulis TaxID=1632740 RepID=UPI003D1DA143